MSLLTPSVALMLPADTPISECVRRMNEARVGSILIIKNTASFPENGYRASAPIELVGMFTERDLLRIAAEIQKGNYWAHPVSLVMSKNLVTLPVTELGRAGEIMLKGGFRHLPVVAQIEGEKPEVIGMVSMRDVLAQVLEKDEDQKTQKRIVIGVLSPRDIEVQALSKGIFSSVNAELKRVDPASFDQDAELAQSIDTLLIDVDRFDAKTWAGLLRRMNQCTSYKLSVILFDPLMHDPKTIATLDKIKSAEKFAVFHKPVNLLQLMRRLRKTETPKS